MSITNNLSINNTSVVNLNGGTLRFNTGSGTINYSAGTIQLAGDRIVGSDQVISSMYGASPVIPGGKGLTVEGNARIQTNVAVNGGKLKSMSTIELGIADAAPVTLAIANGGTASRCCRLVFGQLGVSTAGGGITVDGPGSAFNNLGNVSIGHVAPGTLQVTGGGSITTGGNVSIGSTGINGQGTANVSGAGSIWTIAGNLNVDALRAASAT